LKLRGDCSIRIEGLGFTAEEIADCAARQGLLSIEIELSGEATCDCPACAVKPQPVLSSSEMLALIDQLRELGCRRVILIDEIVPRDTGLRPVLATQENQGSSTSTPTSTGRRPVSREKLRSLITELRQRELQIELITDGREITADFGSFLFDHQVDVAVDFESFEAIDRLQKTGYARVGSPRLSARLFAAEKNLQLIPAVWRSLRSAGITPHLQTVTPDQTEDRVTPNPGAIRELSVQLAKLDREEFDINWPTAPELTGRSCKRHLFAVHVSACGSIYACRGIDIPIGSIRTESLREILTLSEVLEDLRAYHEKVKEPCRICSKTADCYGCRGSAHQLTGDYLAGDSLCWKAQDVPIQILPLNVAGLIPHGPSVRMVDQLVRVRERQFTTRFTVPVDSQFLDEDGILDELAYIEMIAQSFAASHCFHLTPEQLAAHKGLLLGVTNLVISGFARGGDKLTIELKKVTRFGDFGIVEGHVHQSDGSLIASGQVKVWRPAEATLLNP
jgi:radical SAM protein with 4Fe4S-binding SPASM domain